jgi:hypothetical protein
VCPQNQFGKSRTPLIGVHSFVRQDFCLTSLYITTEPVKKHVPTDLEIKGFSDFCFLINKKPWKFRFSSPLRNLEF